MTHLRQGGFTIHQQIVSLIQKKNPHSLNRLLIGVATSEKKNCAFACTAIPVLFIPFLLLFIITQIYEIMMLPQKKIPLKVLLILVFRG
jgi:hypothetical protein